MAADVPCSDVLALQCTGGMEPQDSPIRGHGEAHSSAAPAVGARGFPLDFAEEPERAGAMEMYLVHDPFRLLPPHLRILVMAEPSHVCSGQECSLGNPSVAGRMCVSVYLSQHGSDCMHD